MPGVKNVPKARPAQTTSTASTQALFGHGSSAATGAEARSPSVSGTTGPRRSESWPTATLFTASRPPEQRKTAPIATAPKPSTARRGGGSTDRTPKRSAGRTTNQHAPSIRGSRSARMSVIGPCISAGRRAGVATAQPTRPSESAAKTPNVQPMPATDAIPPITGPKSAPTTAVANVRPIRRPRRSAGASATSHAIAPVHENALATPWAKRAASSCHGSVAIPNRAVQSATIESPTITVGFTPSRAATIPLGMAPTNAPAGYAAARTPAPVLPGPKVVGQGGGGGS